MINVLPLPVLSPPRRFSFGFFSSWGLLWARTHTQEGSRGFHSRTHPLRKIKRHTTQHLRVNLPRVFLPTVLLLTKYRVSQVLFPHSTIYNNTVFD